MANAKEIDLLDTPRDADLKSVVDARHKGRHEEIEETRSNARDQN
jgi:hypothetical protein